ncbi:MAG: ABC transporter permease [Phycisphaerae bacterium]
MFITNLQIHMAVRYLLRRRRQTLICVLGVAIGVAVFVAMSAMMKGFEVKFIEETVEGSGHAIIQNEPRETVTRFLEKSYQDQNNLVEIVRQKPQDKVAKIRNPARVVEMVRNLPSVVAAAPTVTGNMVAIYGAKQISISVIGIEPREQTRVTSIGDKIVDGSFERLYSTANGVLLGDGVARVIGARTDDSVTLTGPTGAQTTARVVGIFSTGVTPVDYTRAYMLLRDAQVMLDKPNIISEIVVKGDNPDQARALSAQIEAITGYKTESWQEANNNFLSIFVIQQAITNIICGAILVVAAFGVFNILTMSVMEKIGDIAIMRSYGLTRMDIRYAFLLQGLMIGVVGAVLGTGLARSIIYIIRQFKFPVEGLVKAQGILMHENLRDYIVAACAAVVITMLAAYLPSSRAARFNPVDILRGRH